MSQSPEERLKKKRALIIAYQNTFKGKDAEMVLDDMRKRFYADYPTYSAGMTDRMEAENSGMRRAWLHINGRINYNMDNLKLTQEDE